MERGGRFGLREHVGSAYLAYLVASRRRICLFPFGNKEREINTVFFLLSFMYSRRSDTSSCFPSFPEIRISELSLLFGDETFAVNPLCLRESSGSAQTLALAEFETEREARMFWALCSAGAMKTYGHRVACVPDPSGYRTFGEVKRLKKAY